METQQDSEPAIPVTLPLPQQALVATQALERLRSLQDTEERKHLHNQTSQKSKDHL
jgi:hypothetical protein